MTQKELVLAYVREFGSILPAKMAGKLYKGEMFGSETSKRCRELRAEKKLVSEGDGKFERFYGIGHQTQNLPQRDEKTVCCTSLAIFQIHAQDCLKNTKEEEKALNTLF